MKLISCFALSLCAFSLSIHAGEYACQEFEEEENELYRFSTRQKYFANVEFLYWKVKESSLEYAVKMDHAAASTSPVFANGNYKIAEFNWDPGFRASFGFYRAPHFWEMFWQYTWFYTKGSNHSRHNLASNKFINSSWETITSAPLSDATSRIDFHYQVGDYLVTRVFDPNPHLRMRFVGGITAAFIDQCWKVNYFNFTNDFDEIKNKWRFVGGGLRLGMTVDWYLSWELYFTGKASLGTLIGPYKNQARQRTSISTGGYDPNIPIRDVTYNDARVAFNSQILLGLSYQNTFGECSPWDLELFTGYEFNGWFNLHEVYRSSFSAPNAFKETNLNTGGIGLHGYTFRATIGF